MKIGVDFGGVLSITDISGAEHRNVSVNMPLAADSLRQFVAAGHTLYLISFCGRTRAFETRDSIASHGLSELFTGQFYVKKKEYKGEICKAFGIDYMIDDCVDVLESVGVKSPGTRLVLFGAGGWAEVMGCIDGECEGRMMEEGGDVGRWCYLNQQTLKTSS